MGYETDRKLKSQVKNKLSLEKCRSLDEKRSQTSNQLNKNVWITSDSLLRKTHGTYDCLLNHILNVYRETVIWNLLMYNRKLIFFSYWESFAIVYYQILSANNTAKLLLQFQSTWCFCEAFGTPMRLWPSKSDIILIIKEHIRSITMPFFLFLFTAVSLVTETLISEMLAELSSITKRQVSRN